MCHPIRVIHHDTRKSIWSVHKYSEVIATEGTKDVTGHETSRTTDVIHKERGEIIRVTDSSCGMSDGDIEANAQKSMLK